MKISTLTTAEKLLISIELEIIKGESAQMKLRSNESVKSEIIHKRLTSLHDARVNAERMIHYIKMFMYND